MITIKTKTCTKCGKRRRVKFFNKKSSSKDGVSSRCKDCLVTDYAVSYIKNKESLKEYNKEYYQSTKESRSVEGKAYREANREKVLEYHRNYDEVNRDRKNELNRNYYNKHKDEISLRTKMKRIQQKMLCSSVDAELVERVFNFTEEWEGIRDFVELWDKEKDSEEREAILEDLEEVIDELEICDIVKVRCSFG